MPAIPTWPGQGEIAVTTTKSGFPSVTGLKNGSFLVVWTKTVTVGDHEETDIHAQIFDATGAKKGQEFVVSAAAGNQRDPVVTALADGGFVVAWEDRGATSVHAAVYGADFNQRKSFEVIDTKQGQTNDHANASVAALPDGGFVLSVTGSRYSAATGVASSYVYNANGDLQHSNEFDRFGTMRDTDTASFEINGNAAYVKVGLMQAASPTIYAQIHLANGGIITEFPFIVASLDANALLRAISVAALGKDKFVVTWSDNNSIKAKIFNADGTVAKDAFEIYRSTNPAAPIPRIAIESINGGFALAFEEGVTDGSNAEIYVKTFDGNGAETGSLTMPYANGATFQAFPSLTALADGRLVVSWVDAMQIRARIFDARTDAVNYTGTALNDDYYGTDQNDTFDGGLGSDTLNGGGGNDRFITSDIPNDSGSNAADLFNGGEGDADQVVYWNASSGIVVKLNYQDQNNGAARGDRFDSIENIDGSVHADTIEGSDVGNGFWGNDGDDFIDGGAGDDTLNGGSGNDVLNGGADNDTLSGEAGDDFMNGASGGNDVFNGGEGDGDKVSYFGAAGIELYMHGRKVSTGAAAGDTFIGIEVVDGTFEADTIEGTDGKQSFWGANGNDVLKGLAGNDVLIGGEGNDTIFGGADADALNGENGFDWASYAEATGAVSVSLVTGRGSAGEAAGDTLVSIEGLIGSNFNDTLGGAAHDLRGGLGDDTYEVGAGTTVVETAGQGTDTVIASGSFSLSPAAEVEILRLAAPGGAEAYSLTGSSIANTITGNAGANTLTGLGGNDSLDGGAGQDRLIGGSGNDTYYVDNAGDQVLETQGEGQDIVHAGVSFTLAEGQEIEELNATGAAGLTLKGNTLANKIAGNAGADKLWGGLGNDQLAGGTGKDVFVFDSKANKAANLDRIADFSVKDDTIWLENKVFAKLGKKGSESKPAKLNKDFLVIGDKAKDQNDYLIYSKKKGILFYDSDGSGKGKAIEVATLSKNLKMTAADFFVI